MAEKSGDKSLVVAVESRFMHKEVKHVKDLADLLQQVVRVSKQPGLGIYLLDAELRAHKGRVPWAFSDDMDQQDAEIGGLRESVRGH